jgi:hypothetical protein
MPVSDRHHAAATAALLRRLGFRLLEPAAVRTGQAAAREASTEELLSLEPPADRVLHLTNGDCVAAPLRESTLGGEVSISADVLHEGPAPAGLSAERWRKVRARYLAEGGHVGYDECLQNLADWDRKVDEASNYDEVVLWFEHDLFDQLNLIRLLALLSERPLVGTRLSLVCIGEYPGIEPFHGLGQLAPEQLAALFEERVPVSRAQIEIAREAWLAFCSSDPGGVEALLARETGALPFLAGALRRHLEEFPSTLDGLSRTERQSLAAVAAAPLSFSELFRAVQRLEERVFQGDLSFLRVLRGLAVGPHPLLKLEPSPSGSLHSQTVTLARMGRQVLAGEADWVHVAGIDRWLGGVHLAGLESPWRWNPQRQRLIRASWR